MGKQILILTTTNEFLRKFELENVKILQKMGYVVHYASNMKEPSYLSDEAWLQKQGIVTHHIEIARSPFLLRNNGKALRQVLDIIQKYGIQLIHCHTPVGGVLGRLAGAMAQKRSLVVIYTAHGFHFYKGAPLLNRTVYYWVEKKLANVTDFLIVINREDYKHAKWFRLKKDGRVYKIPGTGIDMEVFQPIAKETKERLRREQGIGQDAFVLLSAGELNENKNHRIVLEALHRLKVSGQNMRRIQYIICGDGFLREQLKQWIVEYELEEVVTLCGYCQEIQKMLSLADVSVFPSKREGLGMAGLESLAMGIPVIASDNKGTREYMEHGRNGFVCRYDKAAEFANGIVTMMRIGEAKKQEMAVCARASAAPFAKKYANAVMRRIYAAADKKTGGEQHGN